MSHAEHAQPFPKGALIAVAALLGVSLAGTAAVRLARLSAPPSTAVLATPAPAVSADLRFADMADGSIAVRDAGTGALVATVAPDTGGFVRGVMRGLARDRLARRIGAAPPFRLSESRTGRLSLEDKATGRRIDLEAFGAPNRAAFAVMLHPVAEGVKA